MFYRESDTIVSKNGFSREDVAAVDEFLHSNQGQLVRLSRIAGFTDLSTSVIENLLRCYGDAAVISSRVVALCTKCDAIIECDPNDSEIECDLCASRFDAKRVRRETVYVPRRTDFECGDSIAVASGCSADVDGVAKIVGCSNPDRVIDVVFVHGLDGDAQSTWHPKGSPEKFWPKWIGDEIPSIGVWTLGFDANSTGWKGGAMPLFDRANNLIAKLELAGIGDRPIVFVTHSLGGLVVKKMVKNATDSANSASVNMASATCGIVFLATPHSGSDLANYIKHFGTLFRATELVDELKAHHPQLRELNLWFRNNFTKLKIDVDVLFETRPTHGVTVVDATSADPGLPGVTPLGIDSDHIQICKPESKSALVYQRVKRFIERALAKVS
jgi:hypothetical protein